MYHNTSAGCAGLQSRHLYYSLKFPQLFNQGPIRSKDIFKAMKLANKKE